jgi:sialate O-acetylesterase
MIVTDGKSTIKLTNILAGEVWLASGQSNMEFFLQNAADTPQNLVPDTLLRMLNMRPIIHTDAGQWDSISCSRVNRLEHYVDAKWSRADDPTFSAVAWHFARLSTHCRCLWALSATPSAAPAPRRGSTLKPFSTKFPTCS